MDVHGNLYPHSGIRGGGGVATPPLGFCGVTIIRKYILVESLSCDLQDEVNIMGDGASGVRDVIQNGRQDGRHLGFRNCKYSLLEL